MRATPAFSAISTLALLLAICLCLANQPAHAQAAQHDFLEENGSLRVTFGWANSRNNNYATKIIGGLAIGVTLGESSTNEINLESLWSAWQTNRYDYDGNFAGKHTETHRPVLLNYRHYFPVPHTPCAFHVGGGVGCDFMSATYTPPKNNPDLKEDDNGTDIALVAVATGGIMVRITSNFGLDFSYRCMWQSSSAYAGNPITDPNTGKPTLHTGTRPDIVNMVLFALRFSY